MNTRKRRSVALLLLAATTATLAACANQKAPEAPAASAAQGSASPTQESPPGAAADDRALSPAPESDLDRLARVMSGAFSSRAQAAADPDFLDIRLFMTPIWPGTPDRWLYVEQAAAGALDKPYRQRIYRLSNSPAGTLRSEVFTLPGRALDYAGAWRDPSRLADLTPQTLTARAGCAIVLRPDGPAFVGSTDGKDCPSDLRGATYATSEVRIDELGMTSWDRGFDASGKQVWGSEKGGYVFAKDPDAATAPAVRPDPAR